jgi:hypothetical protein
MDFSSTANTVCVELIILPEKVNSVVTDLIFVRKQMTWHIQDYDTQNSLPSGLQILDFITT